MSIFGSIMSKIFTSAEAAVGSAVAGATPTEVPPSAPASPADSPTASSLNISAAGQAPVDVGAVLSKMAADQSGGSNYQTSIVDLLKLLDLDSSLSARKELAQELNVHAGADGSAEENIALHSAVMQKLEENGGKVPASLKG